MKWKRKRGWYYFAAVMLAMVGLGTLVGMPAMVASSDEVRLNTWLLHNCPRALELLGGGAAPVSEGMGCSTIVGTEDELGTSVHLTYEGSRAKGRSSFKLRRLTYDSPWFVTESTLSVGYESVDVVACTGGVPDGSMRKPVQLNWGGMVTSSTRADIAVGAQCLGTIRRLQTWVTTATITCNGKVIYAGHSTVDFNRGAEKGSPLLDYQDGVSAPRAAVHLADTDTARVWSDSPRWEIEIAVGEQRY